MSSCSTKDDFLFKNVNERVLNSNELRIIKETYSASSVKTEVKLELFEQVHD